MPEMKEFRLSACRQCISQMSNRSWSWHDASRDRDRNNQADEVGFAYHQLNSRRWDEGVQCGGSGR